MSEPDPVALRLTKAASAHAVLAILTGLYLAAAQSKAIPADPGIALGAHLDAWFGMFSLVAVAWSLPMVNLGPRGRNVLSWLWIVGTVSNVFITSLKAWWGVHGVVPDADPWNMTIAVLLNLFVVPPTAGGAGLWAYGVWRR